jgi:glycosyltransferase involved in cell wall biosynthesis
MGASNYALKGLPVALRALARLALGGRAVRLCVVGNGPVDVFTREVAPLGLGRHVRFHRGITDTQPYLAHSLESNFARIAAIYEEIAEGSPPRRL